MIKRDSFIFYRSFYEGIKELPRDIQGEVLTAIMEYGLNGITTANLKPIARSIFTIVKPQIDSNNARYENGLKGGAPKGSRNNPNGRPKQTENKPKTNQKQTHTGGTPAGICGFISETRIISTFVVGRDAMHCVSTIRPIRQKPQYGNRYRPSATARNIGTYPQKR